MPTFLLQCGPNEDLNIRKVRIADPMPTLPTFLATLTVPVIRIPLHPQGPGKKGAGQTKVAKSQTWGYQTLYGLHKRILNSPLYNFTK